MSFDPWVMERPPVRFQLIQMGTLPVGWVELALPQRAHWRFVYLRLAGFMAHFSFALGRLVVLAEGLAWLALVVWAGGYWLRFAARRMATFWGRRGLHP